MTINKSTRITIRAILAKSREYDADTMRITRDGFVTARKDADKTLRGNDPTRYYIAHVSNLINADGSVREGWK